MPRVSATFALTRASAPTISAVDRWRPVPPPLSFDRGGLKRLDRDETD